MSDSFLFSVLPYVALVAAAVGTARRLATRSRATVKAPREPWTPAGRAIAAGAATVALNHLLGLLLPQAMRAFSASPPRLFTLEAISLVGGLLLGWGLLSLGLRRAREGAWGMAVLLALLLAQVLSGVLIAVELRWGSAWYLSVAVPYLRSLPTFQPDVALITQMPLIFKVHTLSAFVLLAVAPFVRARPASEPARAEAPVEQGPLATPREETAR